MKESPLEKDEVGVLRLLLPLVLVDLRGVEGLEERDLEVLPPVLDSLRIFWKC